MSKKENRGGARSGAGRPPALPAEYSEIFKKGIMAALEKKAGETGKTIFDLFADKIYDKRTHPSTFAALFKQFADTMVVKESKRTEVSEMRAVIMLPPVKEKPVIEAEKVERGELPE